MKLIKLPQVNCGLTPDEFRDSIRLSRVNVDYLTCLLTQLGTDYLWPELELHGSELFEAEWIVRNIKGAKGVVQFGSNDIREHKLYDEDKYQLNEDHFIFHQIELIALDENLFCKEWLEDNLEIAFMDILRAESSINVSHIIWYVFNEEIHLVVGNKYSIAVRRFQQDLVEKIYFCNLNPRISLLK